MPLTSASRRYVTRTVNKEQFFKDLSPYYSVVFALTHEFLRVSSRAHNPQGIDQTERFLAQLNSTDGWTVLHKRLGATIWFRQVCPLICFCCSKPSILLIVSGLCSWNAHQRHRSLARLSTPSSLSEMVSACRCCLLAARCSLLGVVCRVPGAVCRPVHALTHFRTLAVEATIPQLVAVFNEFSLYPKWFPFLKKSSELYSLSRFRKIGRLEYMVS